jgi:hypothetical protein
VKDLDAAADGDPKDHIDGDTARISQIYVTPDEIKQIAGRLTTNYPRQLWTNPFPPALIIIERKGGGELPCASNGVLWATTIRNDYSNWNRGKQADPSGNSILSMNPMEK